MQMAREYQSAASLIELSADLRSGGADRLGRGADRCWRATRAIFKAQAQEAGGLEVKFMTLQVMPDRHG